MKYLTISKEGSIFGFDLDIYHLPILIEISFILSNYYFIKLYLMQVWFLATKELKKSLRRCWPITWCWKRTVTRWWWWWNLILSSDETIVERFWYFWKKRIVPKHPQNPISLSFNESREKEKTNFICSYLID